MCFDDGGGGFKLEAGVAPEGVAGAVEDAEEFIAGGGVEVVGDHLGVHGEGGGVVGDGDVEGGIAAVGALAVRVLLADDVTGGGVVDPGGFDLAGDG